MRKLILLIPATMLLISCAHEGQFITSNNPNRCNGSGHTDVTIHYGDSKLYVTPPEAGVRRNGEIRFRLSLPSNEPIIYRDSLVEIIGKNGVTWINTSGKYSDFSRPPAVLVVCVPANQALGIYDYIVEIEKIGTLDPRADVEQ